MPDFTFVVTGGIDVPDDATPEDAGVTAQDGGPVAHLFRLPDGRTVRACLALEVMSADETEIDYLVTDDEMRSVGFQLLEYALTDFEESYIPQTTD